MKIVRDNDLSGILMIPLWNQYNIHRCNVRDCNNKQTTLILEFSDKCPVFAMCDHHYFECKNSGQINCTLDFD